MEIVEIQRSPELDELGIDDETVARLVREWVACPNGSEFLDEDWWRGMNPAANGKIYDANVVLADEEDGRHPGQVAVGFYATYTDARGFPTTETSRSVGEARVTLRWPEAEPGQPA